MQTGLPAPGLASTGSCGARTPVCAIGSASPTEGHGRRTMKAITVLPGQADSVRLDDVKDPPESDGAVVVETVAVGICGTDAEISSGEYGWAPPGHERLILGHESIGRVLEAPDASGLVKGDYVVAIVRRPDPEPCYSCAVGEWDFCRNGRYTEHGIKELDGFMRERYRAQPDAVVKVDAA